MRPSLHFQMIRVPDDAEALADWLFSEVWPYHSPSSLSREQTVQRILEGAFSGSNQRTFWITYQGERAGLVKLFDLDDISVAISGIFQGAGFFVSGYAQDFCVPGAGIANNILGFFGLGDGPTLGNLICDIVVHTGAIPAFLAGISYLLGLILGIWGVLKLRDHALNPQQVGLWEGLSRLIAGGAFFALPVVVEVLHHSLSPVSLMASLMEGIVVHCWISFRFLYPVLMTPGR